MEIELEDYFDNYQKLSALDLFVKNQDRFFLKEEINNKDSLIITTFMVSNKIKKAIVPRKEVEQLYFMLGRKKDSFRKVLFNLSKERILEYNDSVIMLLVKGINFINKIFGKINKTKVMIIIQGSNFSAIKEFEKFLEEEIKGEEIKIIDSHISPNTLHPLISVSNKHIQEIKILTSEIYEKQKLIDYLQKFEKESNVKIQIKINQKIHDRIILSKKSCWSIGTSIKDLGNKDSLIKEIKEVKEYMEELFDERWDESKTRIYPILTTTAPV